MTRSTRQSSDEFASQCGTLLAQSVGCVRGYDSIFDDFNIRAASGDIVQIHGRNGCGKSTALRILSGLLRPTTGTVTWNEKDINTSQSSYREQVGYLGHRLGICADLTVTENIQFAAALKSQIITNPSDMLDQLALGDIADRPARYLSAGQAQRTGIAMLVARASPLWILDEPFSALDAAGRECAEWVIAAHVEHGGAVIIATHKPLSSHLNNVTTLEMSAT